MTGNDVTCPHVIGSDPEVMSFDWKSPESGSGGPKTCALLTFELQQGCNL